MEAPILSADQQLVQKWEDKKRQKQADYIVDYFGCKLKTTYFQHTQGRGGDVLGFPDPSDGILHEFIEYLGTILAVDTAARSQFYTMELGAGWGPWIIRSAVLAARKGIKDITMVGVEADHLHFEWMKEAIADNNLISKGKQKIHANLFEGAVSVDEDKLFFPALADSQQDWGAAATERKSNTDYRGLSVPFVEVPAIPLNRLLKRLPIVDLIHVDIQGSEFDVLSSAITALTRKNRILVIGTHNRKIEGDLLDLFYRHGWYLRNETPCQFAYNLNSPSLTGMTLRDGTQIWINPNFPENKALLP